MALGLRRVRGGPSAETSYSTLLTFPSVKVTFRSG